MCQVGYIFQIFDEKSLISGEHLINITQLKMEMFSRVFNQPWQPD